MAKRTKATARKPRTVTEEDLESSSVHGGRHEHLGTELESFTGIPSPFLTEGQWDSIQKLSGLPQYARIQINFALRQYWKSLLAENVAEETPGQLREVRALLQDLIPKLLELSDNPDLFKRQIVHFDRSAIEQRSFLQRVCSEMDEADTLLEYAEERLTKNKRGRPSYGQVYELIHALDSIIYDCLGEHLTRSDKPLVPLISKGSPKEILNEIVKAVNLDIQETTIDDTLKHYIRDRNFTTQGEK